MHYIICRRKEALVWLNILLFFFLQLVCEICIKAWSWYVLPQQVTLSRSNQQILVHKSTGCWNWRVGDPFSPPLLGRIVSKFCSLWNFVHHSLDFGTFWEEEDGTKCWQDFEGHVHLNLIFENGISCLPLRKYISSFLISAPWDNLEPI